MNAKSKLKNILRHSRGPKVNQLMQLHNQAEVLDYTETEEEQNSMPTADQQKKILEEHMVADKIKKEEQKRIGVDSPVASKRKVSIPRKRVGKAYAHWTGGICTATLVLAASVAIGGDKPGGSLVSEQEKRMKQALACYSEENKKSCDAIEKTVLSK
jgi:hypothetical protein